MCAFSEWNFNLEFYSPRERLKFTRMYLKSSQSCLFMGHAAPSPSAHRCALALGQPGAGRRCKYRTKQQAGPGLVELTV